jgi:hypothetical protein
MPRSNRRSGVRRERLLVVMLILLLCGVSPLLTADSGAGQTAGAAARAQQSTVPKAAGPVRDDAGAREAFEAAYTVFMHPRCMNCHPAGDAPLQGDDSRPHFYRVQRGPDGNGLPAMRCSNCHQAANQPGLHAPPGAPHPAGDGAPAAAGGRPIDPRWHLPGPRTPLVFQGRTPGELCRQLRDRRRNGGLTREQLIRHVTEDTLVLWGWEPGEGRTSPPLSHDEFVREVTRWVDKGCGCPE